MNILHLKYAVEVANTGSISKAAENLYMNQPNLSRAIKELEESLGITVFDRTARGINLTADGEEFLNYAKGILDRIDEVEAIYSKERHSKVRFSVCVPAVAYISEAFSKFVKKLDRDKPYEISCDETDSETAIGKVLRSECSLGIIRYAACYDKHFKKLLAGKGLEFEVVAESEYVVILNKEHPLAKKETVFAEDLKPFTEVACIDAFVPSLPVSTVKKDALSGTAKVAFVSGLVGRYELLKEDDDAFALGTPMPQSLLAAYGLTEKRCVDCERVYKDILIYRNGYKLSELDKEFITELCEAKRRLSL